MDQVSTEAAPTTDTIYKFQASHSNSDHSRRERLYVQFKNSTWLFTDPRNQDALQSLGIRPKLKNEDWRFWSISNGTKIRVTLDTANTVIVLEGTCGYVRALEHFLPPNKRKGGLPGSSNTRPIPGSTSNSSRHVAAAHNGKYSKTPGSTSVQLPITPFLDKDTSSHHRSENRSNGAPHHNLAAPSSSYRPSSLASSVVSSALQLMDSDVEFRDRSPHLGPSSSTLSSMPSSSSSTLTTTTRAPSYRTSLPDVFGFLNQGNTCYINSTLQSMLALTSFISDLGAEVLRDHADDVGLESMYRAMLSVTDHTWDKKRQEVLDPSRVKYAFARVHPEFRNSRQQDAHEFFVQMLHQLEHELLPCLTAARQLQLSELKKTMNKQKRMQQQKRRRSNRHIIEDESTDSQETDSETADDLDVTYSARSTLLCPVKRNFAGVIRTTMTCLHCEDQGFNDEAIRCLTLDVFDSTEKMVEHHISNLKGHTNKPLEGEAELRDRLEMKYTFPPSIEVLLDLYFCVEHVERKCEKCGCKETKMSRHFVQIPRVLVIQIKRFRYDFDANVSLKLDYPIEVSTDFDLRKWCLPGFVSGPIHFDYNLNEMLELSKARCRLIDAQESELKATLEKRREEFAASKKRKISSAGFIPSTKPSSATRPTSSSTSGPSTWSSTTQTASSFQTSQKQTTKWANPSAGLHDERGSSYASTLNDALYNSPTPLDRELGEFSDDDVLQPGFPKRPKYCENEEPSLEITSGPSKFDPFRTDAALEETHEIDIPVTTSARNNAMIGVESSSDTFPEDEEVRGFDPHDLPDAFGIDDHSDLPSRHSTGLKGGMPPKVQHVIYQDDIEDESKLTDDEEDAADLEFSTMSPRSKDMWKRALRAAEGIVLEGLQSFPQSPLPVLSLAGRPTAPQVTATTSLLTPKPRPPAIAPTPSSKPTTASTTAPSATIDLDDDLFEAIAVSAKDEEEYKRNEEALKDLTSTKYQPARNDYDLEGVFEHLATKNIQEFLHARTEFERDEIAPIEPYPCDPNDPIEPGSFTKDPPRPPMSHSYQLQAVIHHIGLTVNSGHYVADVRASTPTAARACAMSAKNTSAEKPWLHFDDERASLATSDGVLKPGKTPYLLFYVHSTVPCT